MKKLWGVMVMAVMGLLGRGQDPGYRLVGTEGLRVPVTAMKMTNLVFPVAVAEGVKVSRDILARKVKGVENVVELKAVRRGFAPTNLSVYGKDGRLYSFELRYVEDTTVLNYRVVIDEGQVGVPGRVEIQGPAGSGFGERPVMLTGLPVDEVTLDRDASRVAGQRGFLRRSVRASGMRLQLRGVYLRDSLLWILLRLSNRTRIGFVPAYLRIFEEDRKKVKRTASQEVPLVPVYQHPPEAVPGESSRVLVLGMELFVPGRGRQLVIEVADKSGGRVLRLRVKGKVVLRGRG